jgi:hypothetical protein
VTSELYVYLAVYQTINRKGLTVVGQLLDFSGGADPDPSGRPLECHVCSKGSLVLSLVLSCLILLGKKALPGIASLTVLSPVLSYVLHI